MSENEEQAGTADQGWFKNIWLSVVVGFGVFFLVSGAVVLLSSPSSEQPIAFNHRKHVVDNEMACSDCHEFYEREAFSGLPDAGSCSFCHAEEPLGTSAEEAKLLELIESGEPIAWKPLFRQPPHVFYSHRRHVAVAQIECSVCHGSIGESEAPPARVKTLDMDDCLGCHESQGARAQCTTCHR